VARGWFEIETGVERDRTVSGASYVTPTNLKFGVGSHAQLGVFGSYSRVAPGLSGLGDMGVSLKWRVLDDAPIIGDLALEPAIKLPTGDAASGTGTGTTDLSFLLISSHDVRGVAIDINAGYTHRSGDGSGAPKSSALWTFSFGGPFSGTFGWVAELYGAPGLSGQPPLVAFLAGPTFLAQPWLAFDTGFITKIAGRQPAALYAGAVYNVGRLWGRAQ
jgi:hypothetical protein